jgi:hypothetical protein
MTTPILAQLRDAAEQRGWVRGLTFDRITEQAGRTPEQTAEALRAWRLAGMVKFTERSAGDPETIAGLRITKETRAMTTRGASLLEADMLGSMPEDQAALADALEPLAKHAPRKARHKAVEPEVAPVEDLAHLHEGVRELQQWLRDGDTFPAIRELIARETEMIDAAAAFERHGMADLAEAAMERLKTQTPLERDVIRLYKVLMDLPFDASEGSPQ